MGETRLHHDFEWRSELDVKVYGVSRVTRHESTEVLMCAYAFDDGPVQQWVPEEGEPMPADLREAIQDPNVRKFAWNKPAEFCTWQNVLGIYVPHDQWYDPMVLSYTLSLPGSLKDAGKVMGLPQDKQKHAQGLKLIRRFSMPNLRPTKRRPYYWATPLSDPEEWEAFKAYNRGDVEAEREIYLRLRKWQPPQHEWDLWHLDQEINEAGLPINMRVVHNAIRVSEEINRSRLAEMREITELENPNSVSQLLPWLQANGYPFEDLKKGHIARALETVEEECIYPEVEAETRHYRRVLELRQEVAKASVKKYKALAQATDTDGRLRYTLQFAGAGRTWRWAGRKFQAQNLARPARGLESEAAQVMAVQHLERLDAWELQQLYPRPMDLLSTCVRPVVQAPDGYLFADADLNAIENRVLGWMSGDQKILDVFRYNRDPYVDFATYMYGKSYDVLYAEYKAGDKTKRTVSKPAVLGCGYMLGPGEERENKITGEIEATGLLGYAWAMGVKLTAEQSKQSVEVWRATFEDAVAYWYEIERAARTCIRTKEPAEAGPVRFDMSGPWMRMRLPSGRYLHYCRPRLEERTMPWGATKLSITYEGLNDQNQWVRLTTHPGKLTENADQAIARDLLANGIRLAKRRYGMDIRLHVHDQIVALVPEDTAERDLGRLQECMGEPPPWAPDFPLASAGGLVKYFIKD